jgi:serine/threonine protein kinase
MDILRQVGGALAYAHAQGIVHRDIKPANCAVDDTGAVKLMDFGIASRIQKTSGERAKIVEGTPRYLAPEAAVGRAVDGRADIYSLGIMAFEMVTGRVPFYSETIRELLEMHVRKGPPDITKIRPGLPEGLVNFVNGALVKRPDERLTDWEQILKLLDTQPALTYEVRSEAKNQELVSLRYTDGTADAVRTAMARWMKELSAIPGVEVAHARLVPVSLAESETGRHPSVASAGGALSGPNARPAEEAPPQDGGKRSTAAWLQRLGGLGIVGERAEKKDPPTRAMPTTDE